MKTIFKIIDKIARKNNTSLIELFIICSIFIVNNEEIKLNFKLNPKEKEILEKFLFLLENEEIDKLVNLLIEFIEDFDKASEILGIFFASLISKEALESKDPNRIKNALNSYPKEIREAILKALELLSAVKLLDKKKEIIKEVLKIIIILTRIMTFTQFFCTYQY